MTMTTPTQSPPSPPTGRRGLRIRLVLAATGVAAVVLALVLAFVIAPGRDRSVAPDRSPQGSGGGAAGSGTPSPDAATAAKAFLSGYVDGDGRVVRRDQGDDTVSEGQAYAMLVAAATGDEATFTSVWTWTRTHLARPDGLFSWRWDDGAVVDAESASDADLDIARALVVAGQKFGDDTLTGAGSDVGTAVLDHETATTELGRVLLAGTWAAGADPYAINPSYLSPAATAVLNRADPDPRWAQLDAGGRAVLGSLLDRSPLPPDWAQVHGDGKVEAMPGARGGGSSVTFGYDAMRVAPRLAESCTAADVALAARLLPALGAEADGRAVLDLGGKPVADDTHPLAAISLAAAGAASGDPAAATTALANAARLDAASATYYGSAWTALGWLMLTTDDLGGCPPAGASASSAGSTALASSALVSSGAVSGADGSGVAGAQAVGRHALPTRTGPVPASVRLPSIGTTSGLERLALAADGTLNAPKEWQFAGWYAAGPAPGEQGPAVIAGHVDSRKGPAVFSRLNRLKAGDPVEVAMSDGSTVRFAVDRVEQVPKNGFPTAEVYGPTPDAQLRLITCDGDFDDATGHYVDNLVVFATRT